MVALQAVPGRRLHDDLAGVTHGERRGDAPHAALMVRSRGTADYGTRFEALRRPFSALLWNVVSDRLVLPISCAVLGEAGLVAAGRWWGTTGCVSDAVGASHWSGVPGR